MTDTAIPTPRAEEDKVLPAVVYALHLLGFASGGLTSVAGLIVAYVNRDSAGPINESHYTFAIRSFWQAIAWFLIGGAVFLAGLVLSIVLIGIPLLLVGGLIMGAVSVVRGALRAGHLLSVAWRGVSTSSHVVDLEAPFPPGAR